VAVGGGGVTTLTVASSSIHLTRRSSGHQSGALVLLAAVTKTMSLAQDPPVSDSWERYAAPGRNRKTGCHGRSGREGNVAFLSVDVAPRRTGWGLPGLRCADHGPP